MKKYVLLVVSAALIVTGGLAYWGSSYASTMVHDELASQNITFPSLEEMQAANEEEDLLPFAGQVVDSGKEAKAYAEYINGHLQKIANGKTYSEVSAEFMKDKTNQALAGQRTSLFMGETLRGLLLFAWGWSFMGQIALYVSYALFAAAAVVLADMILVDTLKVRPVKSTKTRSKRK